MSTLGPEEMDELDAADRVLAASMKRQGRSFSTQLANRLTQSEMKGLKMVEFPCSCRAPVVVSVLALWCGVLLR